MVHVPQMLLKSCDRLGKPDDHFVNQLGANIVSDMETDNALISL